MNKKNIEFPKLKKYYNSKNGPLKSIKNNNNKSLRHVPHKNKPPQIVERRNARERRRVEAVNSAFIRLRKAVPIENTRYLIILFNRKLL